MSRTQVNINCILDKAIVSFGHVSLSKQQQKEGLQGEVNSENQQWCICIQTFSRQQSFRASVQGECVWVCVCVCTHTCPWGISSDVDGKPLKTTLFVEKWVQPGEFQTPSSCISSQIQRRESGGGGLLSVATNPSTQHIFSSPKMFCRVYPILENVPSKHQYANAHTVAADKH